MHSQELATPSFRSRLPQKNPRTKHLLNKGGFTMLTAVLPHFSSIHLFDLFRSTEQSWQVIRSLLSIPVPDQIFQITSRILPPTASPVHH